MRMWHFERYASTSSSLYRLCTCTLFHRKRNQTTIINLMVHLQADLDCAREQNIPDAMVLYAAETFIACTMNQRKA